MTSKKETYINYLRDLVYLIKERRQELKSNNSNDEFNLGIEMGYREIVVLIQNQASAFQIELDEFGFHDYEKYQQKNEQKEI